MSYPLGKRVHQPSLAADLSGALGRIVRVAQRPPAGGDEPGALVVVDDATGEELDDLDGTTVAGVVDAHVPPGPPPDPDDELDAGLADVAARTDIPEWGQALIANLRGQAGHQGRAAGRRPE